MMVVLLTSLTYEDVSIASEELTKTIKNSIVDDKNVRVIGPSDATITRIKDLYRRVIYVKTKDINQLENIRNLVDTYEKDGIKVAVDVNPVNMY